MKLLSRLERIRQAQKQTVFFNTLVERTARLTRSGKLPDHYEDGQTCLDRAYRCCDLYPTLDFDGGIDLVDHSVSYSAHVANYYQAIDGHERQRKFKEHLDWKEGVLDLSKQESVQSGL